jgi:nitrile hydratase subunit beta
MGGMHGLGPVAPEADPPVFHHGWEARVHALTIASPARGNIDRGRHERELIPGPDYLRFSYYEKWLAGLEALLLADGHVTPEELTSGRADPARPKATPRLKPADVTPALRHAGSYRREAAPPAFAIGDRVRTRNLHPSGHTRLPRYARGREGLVVLSHGAHVFPDKNAHGQGEAPCALFTVRFAARELWGPEANARDTVSLDLWEAYLERA